MRIWSVHGVIYMQHGICPHDDRLEPIETKRLHGGYTAVVQVYVL